jgi:sec-independent protein translocase protein TatA
MMGFPGGMELFVILLIVLILFGGKKLPELMGGIGKGIKSFKKGINDPDPPVAHDAEPPDQVTHEAKKETEEKS